MHEAICRRSVLRAGLALGVSLTTAPGHACEIFTGNLTILHPWTRASGVGATSAVVCMTFQDVTHADRLIGLRTVMASGAEMGGANAGSGVNFVIHKGQTSELSEAGDHVRLVGLRYPLLVGRAYPMTLLFEEAGPIQASLTVDFAS